jgi:hypothetical protein
MTERLDYCRNSLHNTSILPGEDMSILKNRTNLIMTLLLVLVLLGLVLNIIQMRRLTTEFHRFLSAHAAGQTQTAGLETSDPLYYEKQVAREESARFSNENLQSVKSFSDRNALLAFGVEQAKVDGLFCEFGVFTGATINFIASRVKVKVHGFDSFEGLPEKWREGFDKGAFQMDGLPRVSENVVLHKGWFDKSVPVFAAQYRDNIAFLHMDADLYSSTKTVFDLLGNRIVEGTIINFDEFLNYPGWQNGEFKAFRELAQQRHLRFEYIGRVPDAGQVALKITGK